MEPCYDTEQSEYIAQFLGREVSFLLAKYIFYLQI